MIIIKKRKRRVYKQRRFQKKLIRGISLGICNVYKHKPIPMAVSKNVLRLDRIRLNRTSGLRYGRNKCICNIRNSLVRYGLPINR